MPSLSQAELEDYSIAAIWCTRTSRTYVPLRDGDALALLRTLAALLAGVWLETRVRCAAEEAEAKVTWPSVRDLRLLQNPVRIDVCPKGLASRAGLPLDGVSGAFFAEVSPGGSVSFHPRAGKRQAPVSAAQTAMEPLRADELEPREATGGILGVQVAPTVKPTPHYEPEGLELSVSERQELEQLRCEVQRLRNTQSDLAMGASIKLAAARMVLSSLARDTRLSSREQAALSGVLDMLPPPGAGGHIAKADALARAQHPQLGK